MILNVGQCAINGNLKWCNYYRQMSKEQQYHVTIHQQLYKNTVWEGVLEEYCTCLEVWPTHGIVHQYKQK